MDEKKTIFAIVGSASQQSANQKLVDHFINLTKDDFIVTQWDDLKRLPPFNPEQSAGDPPAIIQQFRASIQHADGLLICTPEYVFSIPSGLKNAIEWCVASTVFSYKLVGLITASANGEKGHEELQLIMKTVMAKFSAETALLIRGIKGKINAHGEITDRKTGDDLDRFIRAFKESF
ncbi:NADPH-dependent FMN reductase [Flavisolibacter nicotianae]|uniref:NADPH-dependent FMN reductase n=1 Tax=Flavisolibacter nicotianae TaxID=2364882 RepID=UPI000EB58BEC|nr:NADPH-dependent FMN reductase [Flavisolibacter nicotianae]